MSDFKYVAEYSLKAGQIYEDTDGSRITILEVGVLQGEPYFWCKTEDCPRTGWFITDCPWLLKPVVSIKERFLRWKKRRLKCKLGLHIWDTYAYMNGWRMCNYCDKCIDRNGKQY